MKPMERRSTESVTREAAALGAARVGVFEWTPGHGRVSLDANAAAASALKPHEQAVADFAWLANFCDESRKALVHAADQRQSSFTLEVRLARESRGSGDGWLEVRGGACREGDPASTVVRGVLLGIDARKLREAEAAELEEGRIQFLGKLAHELRNPLSAVRMVGDLLSVEEAGDPKLERTMPILRRQTARLTRCPGYGRRDI